jgi:hypothetical protein
MSVVLNTEEWKVIDEFPEYSISSFGRIRNTKKEYIRIPDINSTGYARLRLVRNGKIIRKFIHRLVAEIFLPNPQNKPFVDHIDGNNQNNKLDNLRWATRSENMLNGKIRKDKKHTTLRNIIKNGKYFRWKVCVRGHIHTSENFNTEQEAHINFLTKCNELTTGYLRILNTNTLLM